MRRMIRSSLVSVAIMGLLLFAPAGTLAWPQAWALLVLFTVCGLATVLWLKQADPELLEERSKSVLGARQRPRDRLIMGALLAFFASWLVVMALDARRFGWSHVPLLGQALGAILIVGTYLGFAAVFRANRFAVTQVKLQAERGQTVISTGPYAIVRHPMYGITIVLMVGVPLLLGSLWGRSASSSACCSSAPARSARSSCSWTGCRAIEPTPPRFGGGWCPGCGETATGDLQH